MDTYIDAFVHTQKHKFSKLRSRDFQDWETPGRTSPKDRTRILPGCPWQGEQTQRQDKDLA